MFTSSFLYLPNGDGTGCKLFHSRLYRDYSYYRQLIASSVGLAPKVGLKFTDSDTFGFNTEHLPLIGDLAIYNGMNQSDLFQQCQLLEGKLLMIGIPDADILAPENVGWRSDDEELLAIDLGNERHSPEEHEILTLIDMAEKLGLV